MMTLNINGHQHHTGQLQTLQNHQQHQQQMQNHAQNLAHQHQHGVGHLEGFEMTMDPSSVQAQQAAAAGNFQ